MKQRLLLLFFFVVSTLIHSQQDYKGVVLDAHTSSPVPYINIGITEYGIGTVSAENGRFHLTFDRRKPQPNDLIVFSSLGYEPLRVMVKDFPLVYNDYPKFFMKPKAVALNEVVVTNKGKRFISDGIGYRNYGGKNYGYWRDNVALGGELASKIVAKKGLRRLDAFQFEIVHNPSDSLLLRVNVYQDDGKLGFPGTNLNKSSKNIITTIRKNQRIARIDLKPFDLYVNDDFIISLELLKVFGEGEVDLVLAAANNQYGSYRRYVSHDKWGLAGDRSMAYFVESSLMVSQKAADRYEKQEEKRLAKNRIISGFAIERGKMISEVEIFNHRTKEVVHSDSSGRYKIAANKNDLLEISKEGYITLTFRVSNQLTQNLKMKSVRN